MTRAGRYAPLSPGPLSMRMRMKLNEDDEEDGGGGVDRISSLQPHMGDRE